MESDEIKIGNEYVTDTLGLVRVIDIYRSITNKDIYVYMVQQIEGGSINTYLLNHDEVLNIY